MKGGNGYKNAWDAFGSILREEKVGELFVVRGKKLMGLGVG